MFRRYLIPVGTWASLIVGLAYLLVFALVGGQGNLALAISLFALSLSVKAYGMANAVSNSRITRARQKKKSRRTWQGFRDA